MTTDRQREAGEPGLVVWITGLPRSGKSTLARALAARLRARDPRCVLLDGDALRPAIAEDLGYTIDERRRCGCRYARLATLLAGQGMHVVVATVSMFEVIRRWNRAHAARYLEVYLRVEDRVRRARDRDGLYARANVVGGDLPYEEPAAADVVVEDDGSLSADAVAEQVWHAIAARLDRAPRTGVP